MFKYFSVLPKNYKNVFRNYYYHSHTKVDVPQKKTPNHLCIDCVNYIPMEHSPMYPNSACSFYKPLQTVIVARSKPDLCGREGKHFSSRIKAQYPHL